MPWHIHASMCMRPLKVSMEARPPRFGLDYLCPGAARHHGTLAPEFEAFASEGARRAPSYRALTVPPAHDAAGLRAPLRTSGAQVAILGRLMTLPIRGRRMAFWERPTPALADRSVLGRHL
jgi:hypothetical protein